MHAKVKDLPSSLRAALNSVGFHKSDIEILAAERVTLSGGGAGAGQRDFTCAVNLETGASASTYGSWGGANAFNQTNVVDLDDREHEIPVNGALIKGSEGGGHPTMARVYVRPETLAPMLSSVPVLCPEEIAALWCHRALKGGSYRSEALKEHCVTLEHVDRLVEAGLLKRNSAGATQITTEGKNALTAANVGLNGPRPPGRGW